MNSGQIIRILVVNAAKVVRSVSLDPSGDHRELLPKHEQRITFINTSSHDAGLDIEIWIDNDGISVEAGGSGSELEWEPDAPS